MNSEQAFQIYETRVRKHTDIEIIVSNSAYVTTEIFHDYISNLLIPYVNIQRSIEPYGEEIAVLLMDNHPSHCSEDTLKLLAKNRILAISFPPHTSNISQMLDLMFFGALKNVKMGLPMRKELNKVAGQLDKIFRAFEMVSTPTNLIW